MKLKLMVGHLLPTGGPDLNNKQANSFCLVESTAGLWGSDRSATLMLIHSQRLHRNQVQPMCFLSLLLLSVSVCSVLLQ